MSVEITLEAIIQNKFSKSLIYLSETSVVEFRLEWSYKIVFAVHINLNSVGAVSSVGVWVSVWSESNIGMGGPQNDSMESYL